MLPKLVNWRTKITNSEETKVFAALDGMGLTWRTTAALARQTKLSESQVNAILVKYSPSVIRISEVPSLSGSTLVGLTEKVGY